MKTINKMVSNNNRPEGQKEEKIMDNKTEVMFALLNELRGKEGYEEVYNLLVAQIAAANDIILTASTQLAIGIPGFFDIIKDCEVSAYAKSVDDLPSNIDGIVTILHKPTGNTYRLRMPKEGLK
jgi:hypothetical protein